MTGHSKEVEDIAMKVGNQAFAKNTHFSLDPLTILAIINGLISIARLLYECRNKDAQDTAQSMRKPSWFLKAMARWELRKHIEKKQRAEVFDAIFEVSPNLSDKEVFGLIKEVEKK